MSNVPGVPRASAEDVHAALGRLSTSPVFAGAERMRRFLQLVVEETIAGNPASLKEYRIGVDVFDRGQTFDPRTDTIVRVEARRLRKKLDEYLRWHGQGRPVDHQDPARCVRSLIRDSRRGSFQAATV